MLLYLRNLIQQASYLLRNLQVKSRGNIIGIDIGPEYLRLLKINSDQLPYTVEYFAILPMPVGSIVKDEIKDHVAIGRILGQIIHQENLIEDSVAIAIPRSLAIIKNTTIGSQLSNDELESRAWVEASRYFPDLINDIYLDFTITGPSLQDPSQLELVLVACRKDQIKPYLEILKQAGLTAKIVDINCYALMRALSITYPECQSGTVALLNLNVNLSSFIVIKDGILLHSHDQSYDGKRLLTQTNDFIAKSTQTDFLNDPEYNNILNENLLSHLRHTMHFFYSSRQNVNIEKLILSGDCATILALIPFIQKEFGIVTELANPFASVSFSPGIDKDELMLNASSMMLCCGLALSESIKLGVK